VVRFTIGMLYALAMAATLGCGTEAATLPPTAPVTGTITLDGRPMATGEVVFVVPGEPEARLPVTNGAFSGEAYVGQNRVGVFTYREETPDSGLSTDTVKKVNLVADRFSYNTTLTAEVTQSGPNEFTFDAKTR